MAVDADNAFDAAECAEDCHGGDVEAGLMVMVRSRLYQDLMKCGLPWVDL